MWFNRMILEKCCLSASLTTTVVSTPHLCIISAIFEDLLIFSVSKHQQKKTFHLSQLEMQIEDLGDGN